jgi:hypothetical protein
MVMSRSLVVFAAVAGLLVTSAPAIAGGWDDDDYDVGYGVTSYGHGHGAGYGHGLGYGYGHRPYSVASVPVLGYQLVAVPMMTHQKVLVVNQGPTFVPTTVNYITPTVTFEYPRTFPYGSSGYGRRYGHHHHHAHYRKGWHHGARYHSRRHRDPGYK